MDVSIRDIKSKQGLTMPIRALINPKELVAPFLTSVQDGMIVLDGQLINKGYGTIQITGNMTMNASVPCDRCLERVAIKIEVPINEILKKTETKEEKAIDIDHYFYEEDVIKLDDLVTDNLSLNWPSRVLCDENCKGLCPTCGCVRNTTQCNCYEQARMENSPFAVLKTLLSEEEEV